MSKTWKATVVLSVGLNLVCFVAITVMAGALVDAQWENISFFQRLSKDQQALRRSSTPHRLGLRQDRKVADL